MQFVKNKKSVWLVLGVLYLLFIFLFSYLYPFGMDEYYGYNLSLKESIRRIFETLWMHSPKIGVVFGSTIMYLGKWAFLLINPFVQLGIVLSIFYFVYLRLPDYKNLQDLPACILIALLSIFAVSVPSNTLFWIGGAVNYSWPMFIFLLFLCFLRAQYVGKPLFKDIWQNWLWVLVLAIFWGMSNENNSPMAFIILFAYAMFFLYRKITLPKWFYFAALGVIGGLCFMFFSPALSARMADNASDFASKPFLTKIFFHINHMDIFVRASLCLPPLTFLGLLICGLDRDRQAFKNENFILSLICFIIAFGLASALFLAPNIVGGRPFYSATVISIVAFIFLLEYIGQAYRFMLLKYVSLLMIVFSVLILPLFAMPYFDLHKQAAERAALLSAAKLDGKKHIFLPYYLVKSAPLKNYDIIFFDVLYTRPDERLAYLKINVSPIAVVPSQLKLRGLESATLASSII
ncbi:MAG: DUF6056 family protein [Elusimicrobiota bacterium]|jgi:hypothetical protein|nr:DUF6056 family protein [Elusimicrobiota bacterium]